VDLQEAIDAADDGATLAVEGVCQGPVTITGRADLTIEGAAVSSCPDDGPGPSDLRSTVKGGHHVIKVTNSTNIRLRFLNIIGGGEGLEFKLSEGGAVSCSCVARNDDEGIELEAGRDHELRQNLIFRNGDDGIRVTDGSGGNTIAANTIRQNGDDGIEIEADSDGNVIEDNLIEDNVEDGIDLDGTDENQILDNQVRDNGRERDRDSGIELEDSDDNEVDGNRIRGNADGLTDQIRCQSGSDDNTGSNVPSGCR
jgi:parallel beta-helix repeat protein